LSFAETPAAFCRFAGLPHLVVSQKNIFYIPAPEEEIFM
jgi:hypothetical protein